MALKIGRLGAEITLSDPVEWSIGATDATVVAQASSTTASDLRALAQQAAGYPSVDEPLVPVICSGGYDTYQLLGFWEPVDVDVSRQPSTEAAGLAVIRARLRRPAGFTTPLFTSRLTHYLLNNAISFGSGYEQMTWALPGNAWEVAGVPASGTHSSRTSADGALRLWRKTAASASFTGYWGCEPADFYVGAGRVESKMAGGSTYVQVCGRNIEAGATWRLANGLVRVTPSATDGKLDVSHYDGSTWETAKTYVLSGGTNGTVNAIKGVAVLRNSPEEARIRLVCQTATGGYGAGRVTVDLGLRRGSRTVFCVLESDSSDKWKVARDTNEASVAIPTGVSSGVMANVNDASGNRYMLMTPQAHTNDLTVGSTRLSIADDVFKFGISSEIGGSGASAPDNYDSIQAAFMCAGGERVRWSSR